MTPRLGFLGTGWIGRSRLEAVVASGCAEIAAVVDPDPASTAAAAALAPGATVLPSYEALLAERLDGVVIATPSALHASQAQAALAQGRAVFCQKPLGRTLDETVGVIEAARCANRLLGVDLSYREMEGARRVRELVRDGSLGEVFAADLTFHNAYGPDKAWFYDPSLSGGGCVIDLGIHLVDLALWTLDFPAVRAVTARRFAGGLAVDSRTDAVEDYAVATLELEGGAVVRLACSWNLSAGCDAVISAEFFGTSGSAALRNLDGSFYDFTTSQARSTSRVTLVEPPDAWPGRALVAWTRRLAHDCSYNAEADRLVEVAAAIDAIYGRDVPVGAT